MLRDTLSSDACVVPYTVTESVRSGLKIVEFEGKLSEKTTIEDISSAAITEISSAFGVADRLTLKGCLSSGQVDAIAAALRSESCKVSNLKLVSNQLTPEDLTRIATSLKTNKVLTHLHISPRPKSYEKEKVSAVFVEVMESNFHLQHCFIGLSTVGCGDPVLRKYFIRNAKLLLNKNLQNEVLDPAFLAELACFGSRESLDPETAKKVEAFVAALKSNKLRDHESAKLVEFPSVSSVR